MGLNPILSAKPLVDSLARGFRGCWGLTFEAFGRYSARRLALDPIQGAFAGHLERALALRHQPLKPEGDGLRIERSTFLGVKVTNVKHGRRL
jgi:hypothetical protein